MKIFTEAEARALLEKVVKLSVADECNASLNGSIAGNIRFALNNVSTSGIVSDTSLAVQVAFGKRTGVATINEFDDASLERVVRRAEDLARLAPENEEYMPELGPQVYLPTPTYAQATAVTGDAEHDRSGLSVSAVLGLADTNSGFYAIEVLAGDDIDNTADGIRTVDGGRAVGQDFNALNRGQRDRVQVRAGFTELGRQRQATPVNQDQAAAATQTTQAQFGH